MNEEVSITESIPIHPTTASEVWMEVITLCKGMGGRITDAHMSVSEASLIVRSYQEIIRRIEKMEQSERDWEIDEIRWYALGRVDRLIRAGAISQDRVDELNKASEATASISESDGAVEQPVQDEEGANKDTTSCSTFDGVSEASQGPGAAGR